MHLMDGGGIVFLSSDSWKEGAQFPGADTLSKFLCPPFHNYVEGESVVMGT